MSAAAVPPCEGMTHFADLPGGALALDDDHTVREPRQRLRAPEELPRRPGPLRGGRFVVRVGGGRPRG